VRLLLSIALAGPIVGGARLASGVEQIQNETGVGHDLDYWLQQSNDAIRGTRPPLGEDERRQFAAAVERNRQITTRQPGDLLEAAERNPA
jgi:hypothetical protein